MVNPCQLPSSLLKSCLFELPCSFSVHKLIQSHVAGEHKWVNLTSCDKVKKWRTFSSFYSLSTAPLAWRFSSFLDNRNVFQRGETGLLFYGWNNFLFFFFFLFHDSCTTSVWHQRKAIIFSSSSRKPSCWCYKTMRREKMTCYIYKLSLFLSGGMQGILQSQETALRRHLPQSWIIIVPAITPRFSSSVLFFFFCFFSISLQNLPRKCLKKRM